MFRSSKRPSSGAAGLSSSKSKNVHSLEHLKYLYSILCKHQIVTETNRNLLVETLRSITEILIWGDQNDSTVFDFFLEHNMLSFFLKIMNQRYGSFVCVQLLQTLNILFENIKNKTSIYYLLSNNHVNSIIVHRFDFGDDEVMAYYISFLKTLSFKLNIHTIHFFFNEHTHDFPLYTEAIKFFNHPESMVRIAVRTLSLNVFATPDQHMMKFVVEKTAQPYFTNLVYSVGSNLLDLDSLLNSHVITSSNRTSSSSSKGAPKSGTRNRSNIDSDTPGGRRQRQGQRVNTDERKKASVSPAIQNQQNLNRIGDLVAEFQDHLHYINDILNLTEKNGKIDECISRPNYDDDDTNGGGEGVSGVMLNAILIEHLINGLITPLILQSLMHFFTSEEIVHKCNSEMRIQDEKDVKLSESIDVSEQLQQVKTSKSRMKVGEVTALFGLTQLFLVSTNSTFVNFLAWVIFHFDLFQHTTEDESIDILLSSMDGGLRKNKRHPKRFLPPVQTLSESLHSTTEDSLKTSRGSVDSHLIDTSTPFNISGVSRSTFDITMKLLLDDVMKKKKEVDTSWISKSKVLEDLPLDQLAISDEEKANLILQKQQEHVENDAKVHSLFQAFIRYLDRAYSEDSNLSQVKVGNVSGKVQVSPERERVVLFIICFITSIHKNKVVSIAMLESVDLSPPSISQICGISSTKSDTSPSKDVKLLVDTSLDVAEGNSSVDLRTDHTCPTYNQSLVDRLMNVLYCACQYGSEIRLVTLDSCIHLLKSLILISGHEHDPLKCKHMLSSSHFNFLHTVCCEESAIALQNFYRNEEIFLDLFEDDCYVRKSSMSNKNVHSTSFRLSNVASDAHLLIPLSSPIFNYQMSVIPTFSTPSNDQLDLYKRLPRGEVDKAKRSIRVFFMLRNLFLDLEGLSETKLPLNMKDESVNVHDVLDLKHCDLLGVNILPPTNPQMPSIAPSNNSPSTSSLRGGSSKKSSSLRKFLVINDSQIFIVEPHSSKLGHGIVTFVANVQHLQVNSDKDDSRCLQITINNEGNHIHSASVGPSPSSSFSLTFPKNFSVTFAFDDHIRCLAAKQRLWQGRYAAREFKLLQIADLLQLPESLRLSSASLVDPRSLNLALLRQQASAQRHNFQSSVSPHRPHITNAPLPSQQKTMSTSNLKVNHPPLPHSSSNSSILQKYEKLLSTESFIKAYGSTPDPHCSQSAATGPTVSLVPSVVNLPHNSKPSNAGRSPVRKIDHEKSVEPSSPGPEALAACLLNTDEQGDPVAISSSSKDGGCDPSKPTAVVRSVTSAAASSMGLFRTRNSNSVGANSCCTEGEEMTELPHFKIGSSNASDLDSLGSNSERAVSPCSVVSAEILNEIDEALIFTEGDTDEKKVVEGENVDETVHN